MKAKLLIAIYLLSICVAQKCTYLSPIFSQNKRNDFVNELLSVDTRKTVKENKFIVIVSALSNNGKIRICIGCMIKEALVLTVAHCVMFSKPNRIVVLFANGTLALRQLKNMTLKDYNKATFKSLGLLDVRVERKIMHPKYDFTNCLHDIVFLQLSEKFPKSAGVSTIALNFDVRKPKTQCYIMVLKKVEPYYKYAFEEVFISSKHEPCKSNKEALCFVNARQYVLCFAFSGSPVFCKKELYGMFSNFRKLPDDDGCFKGLFPVFTDLYENKEWLKKVESSNGIFVSSSSMQTWFSVLCTIVQNYIPLKVLKRKK